MSQRRLVVQYHVLYGVESVPKLRLCQKSEVYVGHLLFEGHIGFKGMVWNPCQTFYYFFEITHI